MKPAIEPQSGDALVIVDLQKDFLPGGSLAVQEGDAVIEPINRWIEEFTRRGLPVFATRDWHPPGHCSFKPQGGPWPDHCIAGTRGAEFADGLRLPASAGIISKGTALERDAYSGFEGTDLAERLRALGVKRIFVGGLATDYCVLSTVRDARRLGFDVVVLSDAIRAVNVHPDDGAKAIEQMRAQGAVVA